MRTRDGTRAAIGKCAFERIGEMRRAREGTPSSVSAMRSGDPRMLHTTPHGRENSTPATASVTRTIRLAPGSKVVELATMSEPAETVLNCPITIALSPISWTGMSPSPRPAASRALARIRGGTTRSPETSWSSDSSSTCSARIPSAGPSLRWRRSCAGPRRCCSSPVPPPTILY